MLVFDKLHVIMVWKMQGFSLTNGAGGLDMPELTLNTDKPKISKVYMFIHTDIPSANDNFI